MFVLIVREVLLTLLYLFDCQCLDFFSICKSELEPYVTADPSFEGVDGYYCLLAVVGRQKHEKQLPYEEGLVLATTIGGRTLDISPCGSKLAVLVSEFIKRPSSSLSDLYVVCWVGEPIFLGCFRILYPLGLPDMLFCDYKLLLFSTLSLLVL